VWNLFKKTDGDCEKFQESLEEAGGWEALPAPPRQHAAKCQVCQSAASDLRATRELLQELPRSESVGPWFARRVMAAIAAKELELRRRSTDAWTIVPKLARRLSWVSALALVLAGTWLLGRPGSTPIKPVVTDLSGEPVLETSPALNNDELLLSLAEMGS
jgi:hypothetical protein